MRGHFGGGLTTSFSLILPLFGVTGLLVGATLPRRGRRPRRVGDTPHCPKCDYILATDVAQIWNGEIILPNGPVAGAIHRSHPPSSSPASGP